MTIPLQERAGKEIVIPKEWKEKVAESLDKLEARLKREADEAEVRAERAEQWAREAKALEQQVIELENPYSHA
ncbi:hypothetical protein HCBAA847_1022 [Helicobacter cinaedi CCUG 18818 = ATCC BAA-847]|uniref:Uncharacterized protein n=1 Tax=Helicobacter cinaedi CCUG 18818 = ATCC BAA-847 TaxID=537971 RepID=A0AAI8MMH9_9HELI|nr:hypothetical protein HCBAA847_1022 [Helicobacter cinaedi CCUG 18818 = ATCC BAA-847]